MSTSSGSITSNCNPEQVKKKAKKNYKKLKTAKREEELRTLKSDAKNIKRKLEIYGDEKDDETNLLVDRLEELIWQIDAKLENLKTKQRELRQLPK